MDSVHEVHPALRLGPRADVAGASRVTVALKRRHYFVRDIALSRNPGLGLTTKLQCRNYCRNLFYFCRKTANMKRAG
jgi:hypothetical protein